MALCKVDERGNTKSIITHKWVYKRTDSFYQESGRNSNKYTEIDYYFCEHCLEEREKVKWHHANIGESLPDWAKSITKKIA